MKIILKKLREEKGWTQKELSEKSGVSNNYISEIEEGKHMPTAAVLCALARALKVKICDLMECDKSCQEE